LEFIVFRFIFIAPDKPELDFVNGVLKYKPDQQGINRVKNEISSRFRINSNGWNSKYNTYDLENTTKKYRIAIIGDSFVEAVEVDYDKSVAERLESKFESDHYQVYRFGISGAPLSQYLHVLRKEVMLYSPDFVVIIVVHNDFEPSYQVVPGVYTNSFLKIKIEDNKVTGEIKPKPYKAPWYSWIRKSASWRYLAYRQNIRFQLLRKLILGQGKDEKKKYQANIDILRLGENQLKNKLGTDYVFQKIKNICKEHAAELLILMDGDRASIEKGIDSAELYQTRALSLNSIAKFVAQKNDIHFIDLHPVFERDYSIQKKSFNFKNDNHWNSYAQELVANVIFDYMKQSTSAQKISSRGFEKSPIKLYDQKIVIERPLL
jgi:hypothetical protein